MRITIAIILFSSLCAHARDIHVGTDVKTIHAAIKLAQPGDTIHLQPIVYRDYAGFYDK